MKRKEDEQSLERRPWFIHGMDDEELEKYNLESKHFFFFILFIEVVLSVNSCI